MGMGKISHLNQLVTSFAGKIVKISKDGGMSFCFVRLDMHCCPYTTGYGLGGDRLIEPGGVHSRFAVSEEEIQKGGVEVDIAFPPDIDGLIVSYSSEKVREAGGIKMKIMRFFQFSRGKCREVPHSARDPLVAVIEDTATGHQQNIFIINSPWDIGPNFIRGPGIHSGRLFAFLWLGGWENFPALITRLITFPSWAAFVQAVEKGDVPWEESLKNEFIKVATDPQEVLSL